MESLYMCFVTLKIFLTIVCKDDFEGSACITCKQFSHEINSHQYYKSSNEYFKLIVPNKCWKFRSKANDLSTGFLQDQHSLFNYTSTLLHYTEAEREDKGELFPFRLDTLKFSHGAKPKVAYTQKSFLSTWWASVTDSFKYFFAKKLKCVSCSKSKYSTALSYFSNLERFKIFLQGSYSEQNLKSNMCLRPIYTFGNFSRQKIDLLYNNIKKQDNISSTKIVTPKKRSFATWRLYMFDAMKLFCKSSKKFSSTSSTFLFYKNAKNLSQLNTPIVHESVTMHHQRSKGTDNFSNNTYTTKKQGFPYITTTVAKVVPTAITNKISVVNTKIVPTTILRELPATVIKKLNFIQDFLHTTTDIYTKSATNLGNIISEQQGLSILKVLSTASIIKKSFITVYKEVKVTETKHVLHTVIKDSSSKNKMKEPYIKTTLTGNHGLKESTLTYLEKDVITTKSLAKPTQPTEYASITPKASSTVVQKGTFHLHTLDNILKRVDDINKFLIKNQHVNGSNQKHAIYTINSKTKRYRKKQLIALRRTGGVNNSVLMYIVFGCAILHVFRRLFCFSWLNRPTLLRSQYSRMEHSVLDELDYIESVESVIKSGPKLSAIPAVVLAARKKFELELVVAVVNIGPYSNFSSTKKMSQN